MTNKTSFSVSFITRINKSNKEQVSIYCRISVNSKRAEFSIFKDVPLNSWNSSKEKLTANYSEFRKCNLHIQRVKSKIYDLHRATVLNEELISPMILKNRFLGIAEQGETLKSLISYHYQTQSSQLSEGTLKHYKTTERYLLEFLKNKKGTEDFFIKRIDYKFVNEFEAFLRLYEVNSVTNNLSHNVIMKHLIRLRKILNLAVKLEWIDKNPFENYKVTYTKVERGFLTTKELATLSQCKFTTQYHTLVRDLFIFSCYTGISYTDLISLRPENVVIGIDGKQWIHTKRKKTNITLQIPLLPEAIRILNAYSHHPKALRACRLFPPITNQRVNIYLKQVAKLCRIDKHMTFHLARHTFATTITLANGMPIETVSKLLGHTTLTTTQVYAKVLQDKIGSDMSNLEQVLSQRQKGSNSDTIVI
ncbi:site-specific integrase [Saccharicrinis aurantiacus]|uniref:site-specific integrase n=1 Tax=Saccharicrinis aurantiacus TaxID=1849719 RepID=UPI00094F924A|nr:site-specific integrase [Saccharicrinis aurantiacus]